MGPRKAAKKGGFYFSTLGATGANQRAKSRMFPFWRLIPPRVRCVLQILRIDTP